jgi:hypothetical protein
LRGSGWFDDSQETTRLRSGAAPWSLSRMATTIPHNLIKPLIALSVAFYGLLMLLFNPLYIFRRSVAFMPNSGVVIARTIAKARRKQPSVRAIIVAKAIIAAKAKKVAKPCSKINQ